MLNAGRSILVALGFLILGLVMAACTAAPADPAGSAPRASGAEGADLEQVGVTPLPEDTPAPTPQPAAELRPTSTAAAEPAASEEPSATPSPQPTATAAPPPPATATPEPRADLPDLGPAPDLLNDVWINSAEPLNLAALRGKVVLVEFWTFG